MATPNIVPRADSEGGLGTASKYWGSAYIDNIYVGAGKIGRDTDNFFDFSTDNTVVLRLNGGNELVFNTAQIHPSVHDGLGLGYAGRGFSDLFLASGAVINFDSGNVTLTHSSNRLTLADSDELAFGTSNDLRILHTTNSYIENHGGDLEIQQLVDGQDIIFKCDNGSGGVTTYLTLDGSTVKTKVDRPLLFADSISAEYGTDTDMIMYHSGSTGYIENYTGNFQLIQQANGADIIFKCDDGSSGNTAYITLDGGGVLTRIHKKLRADDNVNIEAGSSGALKIKHDGTDSYIDNNTGDFYIRQLTDDKDIKFISDNGAGSIATYFYLDGSSAQHDGSATTELYTNWPDKSHITLGTSHDFHMYHTGTQTVISQQGTGNLVIQNTVNDADISFSSDDGSGGVTEYFRLDGGNERLDVNAPNGMLFSDNIQLKLGTGSDLQIRHDGSNSYIHQMNTATGNLIIKQSVDGGDIIFQCDDGSGSVTDYFRLDGSDVIMKAHKNIRHLQNVKATFGNTDDLEIYHDGSNSYVKDVGTGDLILQGANLKLKDATGNNFLFGTNNGNVTLGHAGSTKLTTKSTGVDVTGILGVGATSPGTINSVAFASVGLHTNNGTLGRTITEGSDSAEFIANDSGASANERAKFFKSDGGVLTIGKYADNGTATAHLSIYNNGNANFAGSITAYNGIKKTVNSTTSNVASAVSGQIYSFDDADGATVTLPDSGTSGYIGSTFEFIIKTTATSNSHKIILSDTTNEKFIGAVATIDTDNDNAATFYTPATSNKAITMNGTTTGITGSRIRITNIAADIWSVEGTILHTGNTATPFTNS